MNQAAVQYRMGCRSPGTKASRAWPFRSRGGTGQGGTGPDSLAWHAGRWLHAQPPSQPRSPPFAIGRCAHGGQDVLQLGGSRDVAPQPEVFLELVRLLAAQTQGGEVVVEPSSLTFVQRCVLQRAGQPRA